MKCILLSVKYMNLKLRMLFPTSVDIEENILRVKTINWNSFYFVLSAKGIIEMPINSPTSS